MRHDLSALEVRQTRQSILAMFPASTKECDVATGTLPGCARALSDAQLDGYCSLDQGSTPACALFGLVTLDRLQPLASQRVLPVNADPHKLWRAMGGNAAREGLPDIGAALTALCWACESRICLEPLVYVPLKSRRAPEEHYNRGFWVEEEEVLRALRRETRAPTQLLTLQKGELPAAALARAVRSSMDLGTKEVEGVSAAMYQAMPWLYQVAFLVQSLLASQIPVLVNAMGHTRLCIGYNKTHLLFADTYGDQWTQTELGERRELYDWFAAGFSVADKWLMFTNLRDIVVLEPSTRH